MTAMKSKGDNLMKAVVTRKGIVQDPPFVQKLLSDPRFGWLFLPFRIWLGWQWVSASMHKITSPDWMVTGNALKGFWMGAVQIPEQGRPPISYDWYRTFIQYMLDSGAYVWFAKLVAVGEMLIGVALIAGLFIGVTAFFAGFMNWNFMMAGSASVNPVFFGIAVFLVIAWKVAGYIGLDYFLLPRVAERWVVAEK